MKLKTTLLVFVMLTLLTGCLKDSVHQIGTAKILPFDEVMAVGLVLKDHPDFPKAGEVKKIETQTGGPPPGLKVNGELKTTVEKSKDKDTYIVTLTKAWNHTVNDKEAKSVWTYKVTPDKAELISSEENADKINLIK